MPWLKSKHQKALEMITELFIFKLALPITSKSLTVLFNKSINQCKFPANWIIA